MSIGDGTPSLTRQLALRSYRVAASQATAGMSVADARSLLEENKADGARVRELFLFSDQGPTAQLIEDEVVRLSRDGDADLADLLILVTRLWADHRLAKVYEEGLTDATGKLRPDRINTHAVDECLRQYATGTGSKEASNVLGYMEQAHLIEPQKHGSSIIGMVRALPTSGVVPSVVKFVEERAPQKHLQPPAGAAVDLALGLGINHWINLTPDEFRRAAQPPTPVGIPSGRGPAPANLLLLDQELRRRKQVILQGAPGVGKTHVAMEYVRWAGGDDDEIMTHVPRILAGLPSHERTASRVADIVTASGLRTVWDIVQFHPSYGYEDFVRTLAPRPSGAGMTFVAEHRPMSFLSAVGEELTNRGYDADVILVVDEMNRADISRVFGELLYALEYRGQPVATPHEVDGSKSLTVPDNLLMIGTMNTADRSIALIDYALRRRFTFLSLQPDRAVVQNASWPSDGIRDGALRLYDVTAELFATADPAVAALAVGHSYFLPSKAENGPDAAQGLARRFAYEVHPLLQEYAAEGLVDADRVSGLAARLGVTPAMSKDQQAVETATLAWVQTPQQLGP